MQRMLEEAGAARVQPLVRPRGARLRRLKRPAALAPLYALYTRRLRAQVCAAPLPHHVAVILDGNRRWASLVGLHEPGAGHRHGADKLDELLHWCSELGIGELTVWALSGENLSRASDELAALLGILSDKLSALSERERVRIRVFGRLETLPATLLDT